MKAWFRDHRSQVWILNLANPRTSHISRQLLEAVKQDPGIVREIMDSPAKLVQIVAGLSEDEAGYPAIQDPDLMAWLVNQADGDAYTACSQAFLSALDSAGAKDPLVARALGPDFQSVATEWQGF